jgi:hypothetical protein
VNDELRASYRVLELDPDSSAEAVKRSYRELVKLWHPDRYSPGSPLQHKAQERLKEINLAYERIIKKPHAAATEDPPPKSAHAAPAMAEEPPHRTRSWVDDEAEDSAREPEADSPRSSGMETAGDPESTREPAESPPSPTPAAAARPPAAGRAVPWRTIGAAAALVALAAWGIREWRQPVSGTTGAPGAELTAPAVSGPANRPAVPTSTHPLIPAGPTPVADAPASGAAIPLVAPAVIQPAPGGPIGKAIAPPTPIESPADARRLGYFTVGSTKAEVIEVQGKPDGFSPTSFQYGSSTVSFRDDRVESWRDGSPPLKARVEGTIVAPALDYFTVGSARAEVETIQGKPDRYTATQFQYGSSLVMFDHDRVVSWLSGSTPLRARIERPLPAETLGTFTLGSSKDDVVSVQGLPDQFTAAEFHFGSSTVYFRDDKVISWQMGSPPLKVRPAPAAGPLPAN